MGTEITVTEKKTIYWAKSSLPTRVAVVELCGWKNKKGHATPTGNRIAKTAWDALTTAARKVLFHHGIRA